MNQPADELIHFEAPQDLRDALDQIGRTEDIQFSPDNRRLALVGFYGNSLAMVDVDISTDSEQPQVTVTDLTVYSTSCLNNPHGLVFLDNETIAVGSRGGTVNVLRLPSGDGAANGGELTELDPRSDRTWSLLNAPGSLRISGTNGSTTEVLVCNNYGNTITKHTLQVDPFAVTGNDVVLQRWLDLPDGIALSKDDRWVAISNHNSHCVMMYEHSSLNEDSDPACILRGASYPHGLRFTDDGRHLFVADAGKALIQIYASEEGTWRGVQYPIASVRVMDEEDFQRHPGRSKGEGGPKGIDIDRTGRVLVMTAEYQRLAFFDLAAIVNRIAPAARDHTQLVQFELEFQAHFREAEAYIAALEASNSFRLTKPLREFKLKFKKVR